MARLWSRMCSAKKEKKFIYLHFLYLNSKPWTICVGLSTMSSGSNYIHVLVPYSIYGREVKSLLMQKLQWFGIFILNRLFKRLEGAIFSYFAFWNLQRETREKDKINLVCWLWIRTKSLSQLDGKGTSRVPNQI